MFCKYCGSNIEDDSRFCPICGKDLYQRLNQEDNKTYLTTKFSIGRIIASIPNIIMIALFFLPWISLKDQIIKTLGMLGFENLSGIVKVSAFKLIKLVKDITQLPFLGATIPDVYRFVGLLWFIPILSIITIILILINKKAYKIISLINLIYTSFCCTSLIIVIKFNANISKFIDFRLSFYLILIFAIVQFVVCILFNSKKIIVNINNQQFHDRIELMGEKGDSVVNYIKRDINKKDKYQLSLLFYCGIIIIVTLIYFIRPFFNNYISNAIRIDNIISPLILFGFAFYIYYKVDFKLSKQHLTSIVIIREEICKLTYRLNKFDSKLELIIYTAAGLKILLSLFNINIINLGFVSLLGLILTIILLLSLIRAFSLKYNKLVTYCLILLALNQLVVIFRSLFVSYWYLNIIAMAQLLIYWLVAIIYYKNVKLANNNDTIVNNYEA